MRKKLFVNLLLFVGSVGWLIPIFLAAAAFDSWVWKDVFPVIYGREKELHSFPYFQASESMALIGLWWCALVIVGWAAYFAFVRPYINRKSG